MVGIICPLVDKGLTDLPKTGKDVPEIRGLYVTESGFKKRAGSNGAVTVLGFGKQNWSSGMNQILSALIRKLKNGLNFL